MRNGSNRVVVMTGDGELNEGTNWEACLVASAYGLDNLTLVVDRNQFQANARTEDLVPLDSLHGKFKAFGWRPERIDGHDFQDMDERFSRVPFSAGIPSVIIADTVRGQGLPSISARADRWFMSLTPEEAEELVAELFANAGIEEYQP
jgi:transketolase